MNRLQEKFEKFDSDNPHVWALFVKYTMDAIHTGRKSYSAYVIFERIRWHTEIETNSQEPFKLNNNHRPYYARKFAKQFPEYGNFFRTRKLKAQ